jgi:hypothetical protein
MPRRSLYPRTFALNSLALDPDGRVRFPLFHEEEDVPCAFSAAALSELAALAGRPLPGDLAAVRTCLDAVTGRVLVFFALDADGAIAVVALVRSV